MIKRLFPLTGTIFVFAFLLSVCASLSMAQSSVKSSAKLERERLGKIMDAGTNIEEFRKEYLNYLIELEDDMRLFNAVPAVQQKLNRSGMKLSAMLVSAKASVSEMSEEDLTKVRSIYAKFPGWREMPEALISPELRQELQARLDANKTGAVSNLSATTDNCADGISAGTTNTDISIAKTFEIAAEALMEGFPTDGLTILARIASIAAHAVTQGATLAVETLKGIKDDCENKSFQTDITGKVNNIPGLISASTSTTAGNITTAKTDIINNDNANTTTIVNNDNANTVTILAAVEAAKTYIVTDAHANKDEVKNLLLRTQIEADLSSTDGSTFVALYETPSSICVTSLNDKGLPQSVSLPGFPTITIPQCGLLDLVRAIVRDTIANVGAGTNAQSFFATADAQKAAGKYKAAYASYRQAYKAASK
jgi:hypothetical protein